MEPTVYQAPMRYEQQYRATSGEIQGTIDCTGRASSDCSQTIRLDGAMHRDLGGGMVPDILVSTLEDRYGSFLGHWRGA